MLKVEWREDDHQNNNNKKPMSHGMIRGVIHGRCVTVVNLSCYDRGFFGTGSYSRSRPVHDSHDQFIDDVLTKQNKWELKSQLEEFRLNNAQLIAQTPPEVLIFTLQEAFYLCFALGSMQIFKSELDQECLTIRQCWNLFCELEGRESFVSRYAAFHYYRSRGWVTRSGVKYGCDYVLYRRGPETDHAQYCVRLIVRHKSPSSSARGSDKDDESSQLTWKELQHHSRLSVTVSKNLLLCIVTMDNLCTATNNRSSDDDSLSIEDFLKSHVSVTHLKMSRYQPEKDRDSY